MENTTESGILSEKTTSISWTKILLGVVLYIIVFITVFGNCLVLVAVAKEKRLQTVFNYYIVNLAVTDIAVAVTAMSFYTIDNVIGYWPFGEFMCGMWIFFDYGMTFSSVFTLLVISVDRFWSVSWSLHYRRNHNKKKAYISIAAVWIVMLILWLPPCITDRIKNSQPNMCKWEPSENKEFVIVVAIVGHHGACLLLIFCYLQVFVFMKRRVKIGGIGIKSALPSQQTISVIVDENPSCPTTTKPQTKLDVLEEEQDNSTHNKISDPELPSNNDASTSGSRNNLSALPNVKTTDVTSGKQTNSSTNMAEVTEKRERKVFMMLTYILFGYMICWVPFHFVFDISAIDPTLVPEIVYTITFWMTYLNSTINPILYNFSSPEFRRTFKTLLGRK